MKKMLVIVAVVAMSFAACGKKKDAAAPAAPAEGSAAPAEGSAAPADGSAAPAAETPAAGG